MIDLTIVTVTFNNLEGLKKTIASIEKLSIPSFEHIVIDGASNDGTAVFLSNFKKYPLKVVSETDNGIYDAMNKGIDLSNGKWTLFMNAGDELYSDAFISIFPESTAEIIYGTADVVYENGFERQIQPKNLNQLWKGMSFSHQAVLTKTALLKRKKFNLDYKYCADFNFIFESHKEGFALMKTDHIIAKIEAGGISDKKRHKATAEVFKINRHLNNNIKIYPYFVFKILYGYLSGMMRRILPKSVVNSLVKAKYK